MRRHEFDFVSLAFGIIFLTMGVVFATGQVEAGDWTEWATPLIALGAGAVLGAMALNRARKAAAARPEEASPTAALNDERPDADDEPTQEGEAADGEAEDQDPSLNSS